MFVLGGGFVFLSYQKLRRDSRCKSGLEGIAGAKFCCGAGVVFLLYFVRGIGYNMGSMGSLGDGTGVYFRRAW